MRSPIMTKISLAFRMLAENPDEPCNNDDSERPPWCIQPSPWKMNVGIIMSTLCPYRRGGCKSLSDLISLLGPNQVACGPKMAHPSRSTHLFSEASSGVHGSPLHQHPLLSFVQCSSQLVPICGSGPPQMLIKYLWPSGRVSCTWYPDVWMQMNVWLCVRVVSTPGKSAVHTQKPLVSASNVLQRVEGGHPLVYEMYVSHQFLLTSSTQHLAIKGISVLLREIFTATRS
jgi:hypothetical protein